MSGRYPPLPGVPGNFEIYYMKRIRVQMPDGSTHEFRASDTPIGCGNPSITLTGCDPDLTGTFLSVDGSRMRLEFGSVKTLYLPDGSRYIFGSSSSNGTLAHTFIDRHGNKMTYTESTKTWVDTLGRSIVDPMPLNWYGEQNQQVGTQTANFPGFGSDVIHPKFTWSYLKDPGSGESGLEDTSQTLNNLSDVYCHGNLEVAVGGPYLFANGNFDTRICGSGYDTQGPPFNPVVLTKIELANQQSYQFKYNLYGEIVKVTYPTGATERFAYGMVAPVQAGSSTYDKANRGVTDRWVSPTGSSGDEVHWTYAVTRGGGVPYTVTITAPDGSHTEQDVYDEPNENASRPFGFSDVKTGRPYEDRVYSSTGSLMSRHLTEYTSTGPLSGGYSGATRDLRPVKEVSMIFEPGNSNALATMTETVYDTTGNTDPAYFSSLNAKQSKKYNYVAVSTSTASTANITTAAGWFSSANLATISEMDYLYDANYKARNINGLVTETRVLNPTNTSEVLAKSQFVYDESAYFDNNYITTNWENPNTIIRGNATTAKTWIKESNTWLESHTMYDNFGNLRKVWDTSGDAARFVEVEYSPTYQYAYPTKTKAPAA